MKLEDLSIIGKIGEGAATTVYKAVQNKTGRYYAIKMIPLGKNLNLKYKKQLLTEVETHSSLNHPNIIRCYGCFENNDTLHVVLELAPDGDLYSILSVRLSEDKIREIFKEIVSAVKFIHERGIVHRDIKPENILVNWEGNIKLGDFGWACRNSECEAAGGHAGTLEYMSPECLHKQRHSYATDIWSLGVLLYELFHNKEPFEGENPIELASAIKAPLVFSERVGSAAKDLILRCLQTNPEERPTIGQVASHHFLNPSAYEFSASKSMSPERKKANRINRSQSDLPSIAQEQPKLQYVDAPPVNIARNIISKSFFEQSKQTNIQQQAPLEQNYSQLQRTREHPNGLIKREAFPADPSAYVSPTSIQTRSLIRPQTTSSTVNLHQPLSSNLNSRVLLARNPLNSASVRQLLPGKIGVFNSDARLNEPINLNSLTQELPKRYFVKREAHSYTTPSQSGYKPFFVQSQEQPNHFSSYIESLKPTSAQRTFHSQNTSSSNSKLPLQANIPSTFAASHILNEQIYARTEKTTNGQIVGGNSFASSTTATMPRKMLTLKSSRRAII